MLTWLLFCTWAGGFMTCIVRGELFWEPGWPVGVLVTVGFTGAVGLETGVEPGDTVEDLPGVDGFCECLVRGSLVGFDVRASPGCEACGDVGRFEVVTMAEMPIPVMLAAAIAASPIRTERLAMRLVVFSPGPD